MKHNYLILLLSLFLVNCKSNTPKNAINKNWKGEWERSIRNYDATLTIIKVTSDSIAFELFASNGANTGEMSGAAAINGNKATFIEGDENDTCIIEFEIFGDTLIIIDQVQGLCGAGMGVDYSGKFYNAKTKPASSKDNEETLESIGLLNASEDALLKSLTKNKYELFLNSTQLTSEEEDVDSFKAKVLASGVRGLFTFMENIIIIDSAKNVWAAVVDDEKVYYFTNREDYKNTLPKTIEKWRERFADDSVIYEK